MQNDRKPKLDIAIVAFNCCDLVARCLASLRANAPEEPVSVVVVDNASSDGTADLVRRAFPEVDLVEAGANVGFARATNLAIRRGSAPYVLALNPDTEVHAGTLDRLLELMDDRPEVAVVGCRLVLEDGTFDHAARRSFPTLLGALGHFSGLGRSDSAPAALAQYRAPGVEAGPVDAVNGAFMLMRRAALDQVGLFDEDYWMYFEDLDLSRRLQAAGWVTWYEPSVSATHVKGGSSGRDRRPRLNVAFHRSMLRFYRRHDAPERPAAVNAAVYAAIGAKLAVSLCRSALHRRLPPR
jgi:N-acetylglucosaminyl-diphospho-decaprenol L-rhamnosyltransferase